MNNDLAARLRAKEAALHDELGSQAPEYGKGPLDAANEAEKMTGPPASDEDYKPWVSIDDDGSVLVELRISPTKRFSIEVNPDGTHESCYVEDGKVRPVPASDAGLRAAATELLDTLSLENAGELLGHSKSLIARMKVEAALAQPARCDMAANPCDPYDPFKLGEPGCLVHKGGKFEAAG